jgi:hypothetical protein
MEYRPDMLAPREPPEEKVNDCIRYIRGKQPKEVLEVIKSSKSLEVNILFKALEKMQGQPDFALSQSWTRKITLAYALKRGDKAALFSILARLAKGANEPEKAIQEALGATVDPVELEKQKRFSTKALKLFQLSEKIARRDRAAIEAFYLKAKSDPEKRIREAISLHPELGEKDLTYVLERCLPREELAKQAAGVLASGGEERYQIELKELKTSDPLLCERVCKTMDAIAPTLASQERKGMQLNRLELFQITRAALQALAAPGERAPSVLQKKKSGLARTIHIDFSKQTFFIYSKWASIYASEGTSKRASGASGAMRLVNKRGAHISERELHYLQKYAKQYLHSIARYTGSSLQEKISIIMEAFESDLCPFSGYERQTRKLPATDVASIVKQIAIIVEGMHKEGDLHRDLKGKNILFRRDAVKGAVETVVSDFGLSCAASDDGHKRPTYGTANFTSPERLKEEPLLDALEQGIKDDSFALGCILYELLHAQPIPWGKDVREYYNTKDEAKRVQALEKYENALKSFKESQDPLENRLLACCKALLNANPKERWDMAYLNSQI